jgi:NAD(P)-dependent dehydrogenase (short-subunit alcohol dehydrogenase family)
VNYLSNALLALELLPLLQATSEETGKPSRLSFVGSVQHRNSSFANKRPYKSGSSVLGRMDDKAIYSGMTVYGDTKLLVAMFVRELAERVSSHDVVINNMCPGGVNTRMSDVLPTPARQLVNLYKLVYHRSVEIGGWIVVNALVVVGKESHGRFLKDKEISE